MKQISILLFALILFACQGEKTSEAVQNRTVNKENTVELTTEQANEIEIQMGELELKEISTLLHLKGKMIPSPENQVSISMPMGGYLKSTKLIPGMKVTKGQVLAIMEDQQYVQLQQEYLTKVAQMKYAQAELNRQKKLNETQASSDKVLQEAQMQFTSNSISIKALSEQLKLIGISPQKLTENTISKGINILSPITGFVSQVNVNVGKYVAPTEVMFELIDPNQSLLKLTVFDVDLKNVSVGQHVIAYPNNSKNVKHTGKIQSINYQLDSDGSTAVFCSLNSNASQLAPGMFMNADIELKKHETAVLPEIAILDFEGKKVVYIVKGNNQYQLHEVQLGSFENGFVEILNAETLRKQPIVTKGAYQLLMEMKKDSE